MCGEMCSCLPMWCMTWLMHTCAVVPWLMHTCGAWNDSFLRVMRRCGSFIRVMWGFRNCLPTWCDSFIRVIWRTLCVAWHMHVRDISLIHACGMTQSRARHDSLSSLNVRKPADTLVAFHWAGHVCKYKEFSKFSRIVFSNSKCLFK